MTLISFFRRLFFASRGFETDLSHQGEAVATAVAEEPPASDEASEPRWWEAAPAEASEPEGLSAEEWSQAASIETALDGKELDLPQLPHVAQRALMSLRNDQVDFRKLAEVIRDDAALTAAILRVANSAAYAGVTRLMRLEDAFVRLGVRALRSAILAMTLRPLAIRTGGEDRSLGEELWRASVGAGVITAALCEHRQLDADDGFVIGLLHNVGALALLGVVHEQQAAAGVKLSRAVFEEVCRRRHEEVGARVAAQWNLPSPLPELIGNHHAAPSPDDPLRVHRLILQFADECLSRLGYGSRPASPGGLFEQPSAAGLALTADDETTALLDSLPHLIEEALEVY